MEGPSTGGEVFGAKTTRKEKWVDVEDMSDSENDTSDVEKQDGEERFEVERMCLEKFLAVYEPWGSSMDVGDFEGLVHLSPVFTAVCGFQPLSFSSTEKENNLDLMSLQKCGVLYVFLVTRSGETLVLPISGNARLVL